MLWFNYPFKVTDIEKDQSEDQNYCYGYQVDSFYRPDMAFFIEYKACCWVDFKSDKDRCHILNHIHKYKILYIFS